MFSMTQKTLNSILDNSLVIDFIEITLNQQKKNSPIVYSGPGSAYQDQSGQLHLKMYCPNGSHDLRNSAAGVGLSEPGKLIKPESLFRLNATDMHGDIWNSEHISVDHHFSFVSVGRTIEQTMPSIICKKKIQETKNIESSILFFAIPGKYNIPINQNTILPHGGITWNICKMNLGEIELQIQQEENYITPSKP